MSGATAEKSPSGVTVGSGVAVVLMLGVLLMFGGACAGCRPHDGATATLSDRTPAAQTRATRDPDIVTVTRSTVAGGRTASRRSLATGVADRIGDDAAIAATLGAITHAVVDPGELISRNRPVCRLVVALAIATLHGALGTDLQVIYAILIAYITWDLIDPVDRAISTG